MGDVVVLRVKTPLDIPPDRVLDGAKAAELDVVFVLGLKDGELYAAASTSDVGEALVLFEKFKRQVI
jgi:hypothetical protein